MKKEIVFFMLILVSTVSALDVIIVLDDDTSLNEILIDGVRPKVRLESINAVKAEVNDEALNVLRNNPNVRSVETDFKVTPFLSESLVQINATKVHLTLINGINITGDRNACVIDSGIYYESFNCTSDDFLNRTCENVPAGIDYFNDDNDPADDHGHGTHVSGIIYGTAPGSNIVSVKIIGAGGSGDISDLSDALNFCLANVETYNISAVSMSLGTEPLFDSKCDKATPFLESMYGIIESLNEKNVTVVAASGNHGNRTHLPAPACFSNVVPVGAANKNDNVGGFSNLNFLVNFVSPGIAVESLWNDGGKKKISGTSQAAPHVAGAVLLLQHYSRLKLGKLFNAGEIFNRLKENGVKIEFEGFNLTRIDVYSSLELPSGFGVEILYPRNKTYWFKEFELNYTIYGDVNSCYVILNGNNFTCSGFNATEGSNVLEVYVENKLGDVNSTFTVFSVDTVNPSLVINSPSDGSLVSNSDVNLSVSTDASQCYYDYGDGNKSFGCTETSFVPRYGLHYLSVTVFDTVNNSNSSEINFSFVPENPVVTVLGPEDGLKTVSNDIEFRCGAVGENLKEIRLYDDVDGSYGLDQSKAVSGIDVSMNFSGKNMNSEKYLWACGVLDMDDDLVISGNRTLTVDYDTPVLSILSPNDSAVINLNPVVFEYNVSDLSKIGKCELYVDGTKSREENSVLKEIVQDFSDSLDEGSHEFFIHCIDELGNSANSSVRSFTLNLTSVSEPVQTSAPVAAASSGGGGGGGGSSPPDEEKTEILPDDEDEVNTEEKISSAAETSEESSSAGTEGNLITGFAVSNAGEKVKGGLKVLGVIILGLAGISAVVFGGAKLMHHDWESDEVGMYLSAKLFVIDKYHWLKEKFSRKTPFDDLGNKFKE